MLRIANEYMREINPIKDLGERSAASRLAMPQLVKNCTIAPEAKAKKTPSSSMIFFKCLFILKFAWLEAYCTQDSELFYLIEINCSHSLSIFFHRVDYKFGTAGGVAINLLPKRRPFALENPLFFIPAEIFP